MADLPMIANKVIKLDATNHADMQRELNDYADDGFNRQSSGTSVGREGAVRVAIRAGPVVVVALQLGDGVARQLGKVFRKCC